MFFLVLSVAVDAALILREGPLKDTVQGVMQHEAQEDVVPIIPADALAMPAVGELERLRSIPVHDLEACANKGFCSQTMNRLLAEFETHNGAVELIDSLCANFCLKSPFSSHISFCRRHNFAGIEPDTYDHDDSEYKNVDLMYCILETSVSTSSKCNPVIREHLDSLLHDKETIRTMAAITTHVCRTKPISGAAEHLLSCKVAVLRNSKGRRAKFV